MGRSVWVKLAHELGIKLRRKLQFRGTGRDPEQDRRAVMVRSRVPSRPAGRDPGRDETGFFKGTRDTEDF